MFDDISNLIHVKKRRKSQSHKARTILPKWKNHLSFSCAKSSKNEIEDVIADTFQMAASTFLFFNPRP
jgi:hypothetical protein